MARFAFWLLWLGPALSSLAGCAQVLGVDDYTNAPAEDGGHDDTHDASMASSMADAGTLFDPPAPLLSGKACQQCLSDRCDDELAACEADGACSQAPDDRHPSGPVAAYRRIYLPPRADLFWEANHDPSLPDPEAGIRPFAGCLLQYCADACEIGRDFSCTGKFDWPATEPGEKELRYMVFDEAMIPGAGWNLSYCLGYSCEKPDEFQSHVEADNGGFAVFNVDPGEQAYETIGYVAVDRPDSYPIEIALPPAPIETGVFDVAMVFSKSLIDEPFNDLGATPLEDNPVGGIWAFPRDCRGDAARHVTVEVLITNKVGEGYGPCDGCDGTVYTNDMYFYGAPDPDRTELNSLAGRAIIASVPLRHSLIVVRDTETRRVVAVHHLVVHEHTLHYVNFWPMSQRQLADLPAALR